MSVIVNLSSFAGSNGQIVTVGDADWSQHPNYTGTLTLIDGRARQTTSTNPAVFRAEIPGNADQTVRAGVYFLTATSAAIGIAARMSPTSNDFFLAQYTGATVKLFKFLSGSATQIGSSVVVTAPSAGASKDLEIVVTGVSPNIAIDVKWDGSSVISQTGLNVPTLDAAGRVGIRCGTGSATTDTTGVHLSSFYAEDTTSGAVTHASTAALVSSSATIAATSARTGSVVTHASTGALVSGSSVIAATASRASAGVASFSTPPIKNNTGTVRASTSGWTINVFNVSTGALVVQKTGLSTDASGVISVSDAALVSGTSYAYEAVNATYGRGLPIASAA